MPKFELEVLNPRGKAEEKPPFPISPRVKDLAGKTVGLYSNGKQGMDNFYNVLEELLKAKYPTLKTVKMTNGFEIRDKEAGEFSRQIDTFVYAVGD
jgi:hypothetical protein